MLSARHIAQLRVRRAMGGATRRAVRKTVPVARWPRGARAAYFIELKGVLADLRAGVERLLVPKLPHLLALVEADKPRLDAADDLKRELAAITDLVDNVIPEERAERIARKAGREVADFNKGEINGQFRASLGIDLLHGEPYLAQQLEMFTADNVRLITSLASEHLDQVAGIVMRGARAGTPVARLRDEIAERFDVAQSRAELIARDQVGKFNGELTELRHKSVGVSEYDWSTSRDEKVRTRHAELEGTRHRWDDPPVVDKKTGRRANPGQDFGCRCTAIPVVDDLLAALAAPDGGGQPPPPPPPPAAPPPPPSPPSTPPTASTPPTRSTPSDSSLLPTPGPDVREPTVPPARPSTSPARTTPPWMTEADKVVEDKPAGSGANAARFLTFETDAGNRRGVWKAADNEEKLRRGIRRGTSYQRDVALHDLDRALGGEPVVPSTVVRELDGQVGSLQQFVPGEPTYKIRETLDSVPREQLANERSVRRTFLLDVISANDDRHGENALWRQRPDGGFEVVPIDHGLAFPDGRPSRFLFLLPDEQFQRAMLKLDETSVAELRALSLPKVAEILHEQPGITSRQVRETLARIRSLQVDPEQLARFPESKLPAKSMRAWLGRAPEKRGLSDDDLAEIDRLAEKPK